MRTLLLLSCLVTAYDGAAGPARVATIDRSLWPRPLVKSSDFDLASRLEILAFAERLGEVPASPEKLREWLKVKSVNAVSFERWRVEKLDVLAMNFAAANLDCARGKDLHCVLDAPKAAWLTAFAKGFDKKLLPEFAKWREASRRFYDDYVYEQARIAALFPNPTSELLTHSPSEITGEELDDREFLLSFDDGPTAESGTTDKIVEALRGTGVSAWFFVLGDALGKRSKATSPEALRKLYAGNCVGSHGREHISHQRSMEWRLSVEETTTLIKNNIRDNVGLYPLFRPPYGQRGIELTRFVEGRESRIILWNIDSQDWNPLVEKSQVADRAMTLMLLWRRGILLFHDVHDKAQVAVPKLVKATKGFAKWGDCRKLVP